MKNNNENIDKIIKEALTQEEAKFYDELDEQNLFQMIGGLFQGKMKWIMLLMNIIMVIFFGLFIYCVIVCCCVAAHLSLVSRCVVYSFIV